MDSGLSHASRTRRWQTWVLVTVGGILVAWLGGPNLGMVPDPEGYVADESDDLDGDTSPDVIVAEPAGPNPQQESPGEVYVLSGEDGGVVVTLQGEMDGDWFGYSLAVAGDLSETGLKDLIIGAPRAGAGRAYVFYGPFGTGGNPLTITASVANMTLASPFPEDYDFGELVGPVSDLTEDGTPELRVRAWFIDASGFENSHSYIIDGATADVLVVITGNDPFDPWAYVEGDVDGDGDVDQNDLDIILDNQGLAGEGLTTFDGDVNGDGAVDMLDYDVADGNLGDSLFDFLLPGGNFCHCENGNWVCPGGGGFTPENLNGLCSPNACTECNSASVYYPVDINFPEYTTPFGGWEEQDIIEGAELIEIISIDSAGRITFVPLELGYVQLMRWTPNCDGACGLELELYIVDPLPGDTDADGLPDSCEFSGGSHYLDANDPLSTLWDYPDFDGDGLIDIQECALGTNKFDPDSDGDGLLDGWEFDHGYDPADQDSDDNGIPDGLEDPDGDGFPNVLEWLFDTDPFVADQDLDSNGIPDGFVPDPLCEVAGADIDAISLNGVWLTGSLPETFFACVGSTMQFHAGGEPHDPFRHEFVVVDPTGCVSGPDFFFQDDGSCQSPEYEMTCAGSATIYGTSYIGTGEVLCVGVQEVVAVKVSITDIKGLYKPDGTYVDGDGYKSEDGAGRIYSNRHYDPANPSSTIWQKDTEYIDITVEVKPAAKLPQGTLVQWTWEDPDDPSDSAADPSAAATLDPNGPGGNDNTGDLSPAAPATRWEGLPGYALVGNNRTEVDASGISKVRFHVTDDGGDNFIVRARAVLPSGTVDDCVDGGPEAPATHETGIMTVWKRIQLENVRMPSGQVLPLEQLNNHFDRAFVQWDTQDTRVLANDLSPMGQDPDAAGAASKQFVQQPPDGEFENAGENGWFFLGSCVQFEAETEPQTMVDHNTHGNSVVGQDNWPPDPTVAGIVGLPIPIPDEVDLDTMFEIRIYNGDGSTYAPFEANVGDPNDRRIIVVYAPYYQDEENPNSNDYKTLAEFGFLAGSQIPVDARLGGKMTVGDTPYEKPAGGSDLYFLGRSNVFQREDASTFIWTIVHELTHALGMAHNCGNQDYIHAKTCTMTYARTWLQDATGAVVPWSGGNRGPDLCAEHIKAVRRANLETDQAPPGWRMLGW